MHRKRLTEYVRIWILFYVIQLRLLLQLYQSMQAEVHKLGGNSLTIFFFTYLPGT